MRALRLAPLLLLLAVPALGQDPGRAPARGRGAATATGTRLLDAAPARADIVLHTPDLPALLEAEGRAGMGDAAAWRAAFERQLAAWGAMSGEADRLVRGGTALLRAADGEVLLAAVPAPPMAGPERGTLLAFRTTWKAAALRGALDDVVAGGLAPRWPGAPERQVVMGRDVIAYPGTRTTLLVYLDDGIVAVSDHALALGLFLRGLERTTGGANDAGPRLLEVRHGDVESAWTGWIWGERESVSWHVEGGAPVAAPLPLGVDPLVAVALPMAGDAPVLPVPVDSWVRAFGVVHQGAVSVAYPRAGGAAVCGRDAADGTHPGADAAPEGALVTQPGVWALLGRVPGAASVQSDLAAGEDVAGGMSLVGVVRAWASGRLPPPIPGVDPTFLEGPASSLPPLPGSGFAPWHATANAGELRGAVGTGPATALALRALRDIATKTGPGERGPRPAGGEPAYDTPQDDAGDAGTGAPLPDPKDDRAPLDDSR